MDRKTRIYLSGPMRGIDEEISKENFEEAYKVLKKFDYDCYMPGQPAIADLNDNRTFFLTDMVIIISWADAIVLVSEDWKKSLGCQAEVRTAFAIGLRVWQIFGDHLLRRVYTDADGSIIVSELDTVTAKQGHNKIGGGRQS